MVNRFRDLQHMIRFRAETDPEGNMLYYDGAVLSNTDFLFRVREESETLSRLSAESGANCVAIAADGKPDSIIEIFAANQAGLQIVMADPGTTEETLLEWTDAGLFWKDGKTAIIEGRRAEGEVNDKILFFTSGTTSRSKAVVLTGESLAQSAYNGASMLPLTPNDTLLCILPLSHVFGFVCSLLWGISCGASVALGRGRRHLFDDFTFYHPTAVAVVPQMLEIFLRTGVFGPELQLILVGAGMCGREIIEAVRNGGRRIAFGYGLTETSSGVAMNTGGEDPYALTVCPDDEIRVNSEGELEIRADTCMMKGYYKMPGDTAEVLRDHWLRTGDLGSVDEDEHVRVFGRRNDVLVLSSGMKIFLPEYEEDLYRALSQECGIRELAVVQDGKDLVLAVFGTDLPADRILRTVRRSQQDLPLDQRIRRVTVLETVLPRTATGKLKRWELQRLLEEEGTNVKKRNI